MIMIIRLVLLSGYRGAISLVVLSMWILNALDLALKFSAVLCSSFNPGCVQLCATEGRLGWSLSEKHFLLTSNNADICKDVEHPSPYISLSMWILDSLDLFLEFDAVYCSSFNPGYVQRLWFLNMTDAASHCSGRWVNWWLWLCKNNIRHVLELVCKYPFNKLWSWTCYWSWQEMKVVVDIHSWVVLLILFSSWSSRVGAEDPFQYEDWTVSYINVSPLGVWQQVSFCITESLIILFYFKLIFHLSVFNMTFIPFLLL